MTKYKSVELIMRDQFQRDFPDKMPSELLNELTNQTRRLTSPIPPQFEGCSEDELLYIVESCTYNKFWRDSGKRFKFPGVRPDSLDNLPSSRRYLGGTSTDCRSPGQKTSTGNPFTPGTLAPEQMFNPNKNRNQSQAPFPTKERQTKQPNLPLLNGNIQYAVYPPVNTFIYSIGQGGCHIKSVQNFFGCQISHKHDVDAGIFVLYAEPRYEYEQIIDPEVRGKVEAAYEFLRAWKEYTFNAVRDRRRRIQYIHDFLQTWRRERRDSSGRYRSRSPLRVKRDTPVRGRSRSPVRSRPEPHRQRELFPDLSSSRSTNRSHPDPQREIFPFQNQLPSTDLSSLSYIPGGAGLASLPVRPSEPTPAKSKACRSRRRCHRPPRHRAARDRYTPSYGH